MLSSECSWKTKLILSPYPLNLLDILLNVFLAIAVDNLADAESLTAIDKEEEVSLNPSKYFLLYKLNYTFFFLLSNPKINKNLEVIVSQEKETMSIKVIILKVYQSKKNFQMQGIYIQVCLHFIFYLSKCVYLHTYSSSRKDYESDNNIKIDLEGSDFEQNENQGKIKNDNIDNI